MKIAVIGSRTLNIKNIADYIPSYCTEIVSGGARGIDKNADDYANRNNIKLTVFFPEYSKFGRAAPLHRNLQIAEYSDELIAFWDGKSKGTLFTINTFMKLGKKTTVITVKKNT